MGFVGCGGHGRVPRERDKGGWPLPVPRRGRTAQPHRAKVGADGGIVPAFKGGGCQVRYVRAMNRGVGLYRGAQEFWFGLRVEWANQN